MDPLLRRFTAGFVVHSADQPGQCAARQFLRKYHFSGTNSGWWQDAPGATVQWLATWRAVTK
jgi:hypothetical protein